MEGGVPANQLIDGRPAHPFPLKNVSFVGPREIDMTDWLDQKLAEQSERDRNQREKEDRESRQAKAVRTKLPEFVAALEKHIEILVSRYNEANIDRPDREMFMTSEANGDFAVGSTGVSSPIRSVYCSANAENATFSAEWRVPDQLDSGDPQRVDLEVMIRRDGEVVLSEGTVKYRGIDELARFLLVPVMFPEALDEKPSRHIALGGDDEDEPF